MNTFIRSGIAAAIVSVSFGAQAGPVDLSGWGAQGGASNWNVQGAGNDTVIQRSNGAPTVFFDPTATSTQGTALSGTISVNDGDDDFIGFVLGYQSGEIFSSTADYFLVDWKKGDQAGWGQGLSISRVTDGSGGNTTGTGGSFWQHDAGEVDLITRANNLGNTGWTNLTEYTFDIVFTSSLISVAVNGVEEININPGDVAGISSFSDGAFGFYNYSQANVTYAGIVETDCTANPGAPECQTGSVPAPATLALFGLGLLGFGATRRRKV